MDQSLQKPTEKALTFANQPDEFLTQFEAFLLVMQDAYRSKLSEPEQQLWIRGLCQGQEKFSMQEIVAALDEMVRNPPLYEVPGPDGPVTQKWRGMPKLPDLIETMLALRSKAAREAYRKREEEQREEQRQLEQRRADHPEEFFGWGDVLKALEEIKPEADITLDRNGVMVPGKTMEPVSNILMSDEEALRRTQQMNCVDGLRQMSLPMEETQ